MILVVTNRPRYSNLVVSSPTFDDQGEYVCRVRNGTNNLLTQTITALIFERVEITTQSMLSYEAKLCERVALRCDALHQESIRWTRTIDGGFPREIANSSDGRISVLSDQLLISETKLSDNGTYTCIAWNSVSQAYIMANLNIGNFDIMLLLYVVSLV